MLRGLVRGEKCCIAGADVWRRIWDRLRDIGEEAHRDPVTKCEAHLSKAERARLDEAERSKATGNERPDRVGKRRCASGHVSSSVVRLV